METMEETNSTVTISEATEQPAVEENKVEFKAPTEEEYKKALQSASSKAKFDILKELGVNSVQDFKKQKNEIDTIIQQNQELQKQLADKEAQHKEKIIEMENMLVLTKANIDAEYVDDVKTLAKTKVSESVTFEQAVQQVLNKNPQWTNNKETIRLGTEKTKNEIDNRYFSEKW